LVSLFFVRRHREFHERRHERGADAGSEARIPALLKKVKPFGSAGFLSFLKKTPSLLCLAIGPALSP
jgi:hypothetical protein